MKILIKFMPRIKAFIKEQSAKLSAWPGRWNTNKEIGKTWTWVEDTEREITNSHQHVTRRKDRI